jgi:hypothetical protein
MVQSNTKETLRKYSHSLSYLCLQNLLTFFLRLVFLLLQVDFHTSNMGNWGSVLAADSVQAAEKSKLKPKPKPKPKPELKPRKKEKPPKGCGDDGDGEGDDEGGGGTVVFYCFR